MRITIFTIGTQGDARPFAALGHHLQHQGHEVTIATGAQHRPLIEAVGVRHHEIESDFAELQMREHVAIDRGGQLGIGRRMAQALRSWMPLWAEQGMAATNGADLVLGSGSGTILGGSLAEKRGLPFVQAQFMPLTPSRHVPPLWPEPRGRLPGAANLAIGHATRLAMWRLLAPATTVLRDTLRLPAYPWRGPWHSPRERALRRPILYAFSRHLLPPPPDWPRERSRVVGFWHLDVAQNYAPPPALAAFLAAGPPPVYIGFGSMLTGRTQEFTRVIVEAVRRSGRRVVLATGWGALDAAGVAPSRDLMVVQDVPHDWLFPRMAVAVHHGGAGTVAAAARAGLPQVVVPFLADQFFWAWRLREAGLSPVRLDRRRLTPDALADAIHRAGDDRIVGHAQRIGALIRAENGMAQAQAALEGWGLLPHATDAGSAEPTRVAAGVGR